MGSNEFSLNMYRPLPKELTIKNSAIEGLGLFATQDIKKNSYMLDRILNWFIHRSEFD